MGKKEEIVWKYDYLMGRHMARGSRYPLAAIQFAWHTGASMLALCRRAPVQKTSGRPDKKIWRSCEKQADALIKNVVPE